MLRRVTFTPTLSTDQYHSGDVLFATMKVPGAVYHVGGIGWVRNVTLHDAAGQSVLIDLVFMRANKALGTIHAAPSMAAADAVYVTGVSHVAATDYHTVGTNVTVGEPGSANNYAISGAVIQAVEGTQDIYVAGIVTGTPTFAAGSLVIDLWVDDNSD